MKIRRIETKKFRKIMQKGGLPMILVFMVLYCIRAEPVFSQNVLNKDIKISSDAQSLAQVLVEIENSLNVTFTYSIQKIDIDQPISHPDRIKNISHLLDKVLDPLSIEYRIFNNRNIVLRKKTNPIVRQGIILRGAVVNEENEPIQFANAILKKLEGNQFYKGYVTDELGHFIFENIDKGKYELSLSYIGYESIDTMITIGSSIDLGTITMKDHSSLLNDVSVTSRRKLIKQKVDRLVVDIENSMLAIKGDAFEVLAATPGLSVHNNEIKMIGKSSLGILVNDKRIQLGPEEMLNYLRSISSEDIQLIEVISNPPAKYEAEGNSGLVNIILKTTKANSWNASVRTGFSKKTKTAGNIGASLLYNKNKLSVASSVFFIDGKYYQEQDDYAYFPDGLWYTLSPLLSDYRRFNARIDMDYQLNSNWSIGAQYMRNTTDYLITDNPYTPVIDYNTGKITRYLLSTFSQMTWKPEFNSANINSTIVLDTSGRKMKVNLDYFKYKNQDIREYDGESVIYNPSSIQFYGGINANQQEVENISGSIDFDVPTQWAMLGLGVKTTRSVSTNDIELFNSGLVESKVTSKPLEENDFEYVEQLSAVYFSISKTLNSSLEMQMGLRMEHTQTESTSDNLELEEVNDYTKLFPTLFLNYRPSENASYSLNYGRRINRPSFGELNPNVFFINPFQTIVGNAFLQPSFTDNIELSSLHGNLSNKIYYSKLIDGYSQIPIPNSNTNIITFANENYVNTYQIGWSSYYIFDKYSWWSSGNSFDINYSNSSFDLDTPHENLTGFNSSISTSNDFSIPSIKGLTFNIGYAYDFRGRDNIFNTGSRSNLSAAIRYVMLNNKLRISLSGNDLTKDYAERLETTVNEVFQTARYYYDSRTIYLSISYSWGNDNISAKRHSTGNSEERSRTGN